MNYKLIDSEFDQMLRDAMADLPPPTDEELDAMLDEMWKEEQERQGVELFTLEEIRLADEEHWRKDQKSYWSGRSRVRV